MKVPEVADVGEVAPVVETGLPLTAVPPVVQLGVVGPHTKKLTVPVGAPKDPEMVAVSVTEPPRVNEERLACVVMSGVTGVIVEVSSESLQAVVAGKLLKASEKLATHK